MGTRGRVRNWSDEEGRGVVDSVQTPGGCWVHYSAVDVPGFASLEPGQDVVLEWEQARQDGFGFRALAVRPVGSKGLSAS